MPKPSARLTKKPSPSPSADNLVTLAKPQLVEIYQSSKSNVSEHIKHIFEDGELNKDVVVRKFRTTTQHGAIERVYNSPLAAALQDEDGELYVQSPAYLYELMNSKEEPKLNV